MIERIVIALVCGSAIFLLFGRKGIPAGLAAVLLAWSSPQVAIGCAGIYLLLFLVSPKKSKQDEMTAEIIDVEFEVKE